LIALVLSLANGPVGLWVLVPLWATLIYGLSYGQGRIAGWLAGPNMVFLGAISFSMYMLHYLVMQCGLTLITLDDLLKMPVGYGVAYIGILWGLTVLLAWASYLWLESPMQRLLGPKR
jgi:peptidoglycan/LPS O-acetylase OafA/YrhL